MAQAICRTELHTCCADKFAVRDHVAATIGEQYLIPLVFHTQNPADIVVDNLPDYPMVQAKLTQLLQTNYYRFTREWQYKNIQPCILVEKLLVDEDGKIPFDYKLHSFNGRVEIVQVDIDRQIDHRRNLYDRDWRMLPCDYKYKRGRDVEQPEQLEAMLVLAEMFGREFVFVRADFCIVDGAIYFGELTFHPESGYGRFTPAEWDIRQSAYLDRQIRKRNQLRVNII